MLLPWEGENPATSECPGYIWAAAALWHRGVTYPHGAKPGTPLWAPGLHSAYRGLKSDSPTWKITSPITPCLLPPPQLRCWHVPQSHLKGRDRISWVTAPLVFTETWQQSEVSGFGISSTSCSACPTCWKLNAIRRVWSSTCWFSKCYCFPNAVREVYLWTRWNLPLAWFTLYRQWHKSKAVASRCCVSTDSWYRVLCGSTPNWKWKLFTGQRVKMKSEGREHCCFPEDGEPHGTSLGYITLFPLLHWQRKENTHKDSHTQTPTKSN